MQHDLRIEEFRSREPQIYAWCVCGGWWYQSENLGRVVILEQFVMHLHETQRRTIGLQPDEQGHWG